MDNPISLQVTVYCSTQDEVVRAHDALARLQLGLCLEGLMVTTTMTELDLEDLDLGSEEKQQ